MEKTKEDIRDEIQAFQKLSPEKRTKEIENLKARIKTLDGEIVSNRNVILDFEKKAKNVGDEMTTAQGKYSEAREKRKKLFAMSMDTTELDSEIWKLHLDIEGREAIRADALAGTQKGISDLAGEIKLLEAEKAEIQTMILRYDGVPMVGEINHHLAEASRIFEELLENQERLDYAFNPHYGERFIMVELSSWKFMDHVPKLYLAGDETGKRFPDGRVMWTWSYREYLERRKNRIQDYIQK
jgi:chromosome segregation ATPase